MDATYKQCIVPSHLLLIAARVGTSSPPKWGWWFVLCSSLCWSWEVKMTKHPPPSAVPINTIIGHGRYLRHSGQKNRLNSDATEKRTPPANTNRRKQTPPATQTDANGRIADQKRTLGPSMVNLHNGRREVTVWSQFQERQLPYLAPIALTSGWPPTAVGSPPDHIKNVGGRGLGVSEVGMLSLLLLGGRGACSPPAGRVCPSCTPRRRRRACAVRPGP